MHADDKPLKDEEWRLVVQRRSWEQEELQGCQRSPVGRKLAGKFPTTTNCYRYRENDGRWWNVKCSWLTGRQGRWWLTLRGTQLMMSYDVAARQSLPECYQESRLLETRKRWCHVLFSSLHSNVRNRNLTDRCRRRWIHSHSSSLFVAVINVVYSATFCTSTEPTWWSICSLAILCYTISQKTYVFKTTPVKMNQL